MVSCVCPGLQLTAKWPATFTRMLPVWVLSVASCDTAAKQLNEGGADGALQIRADELPQSR